MDDVALNKAEVIERCVRRVRAVHAGDPRNLTDDITRQDSIILNLQRACEASIDRLQHVPFLENQEVRRIWDSYMSDSRSMHWSRPLALVVLGSAIG